MFRIATILLLGGLAGAQTINFEFYPDGSPVMDGDKISDEFNVAPFWVRFELEGGGKATIAQIGGNKKDERTAFLGPRLTDSCSPSTLGKKSTSDMPAENQGIDFGCFVLTDDGKVGPGAPAALPLIIRYTMPVSEASGYVLDIDEKEEFTVSARDKNDVVIVSHVFKSPGVSGNGKGVFWFFQPGQMIYSIRIASTGSSETLGIAFDNFSPGSRCSGEQEFYGRNVAGSGDLAPRLVADCAAVVTAPNLRVVDGLGGAHGCIVLGDSRASIPAAGGTLLVSPTNFHGHLLSGATGVPGVGTHTWSFGPLALSMLGEEFFFQAAYMDPGAPGGVSFSRGLRVVIGGTM